MTTFIVGGTARSRIIKCEEHGLNPYSRDVVLAGHPEQLLGHTVTPDDKVIWAYGSNHYDYELRLELKFARLKGGSS